MAAQLNPLYTLQSLVDRYLSKEPSRVRKTSEQVEDDPGWIISEAEEIKQEGEDLVEDYKPDLEALAATGEQNIQESLAGPTVVQAAEGVLDQDEPVPGLASVAEGEDDEEEGASEEEVSGALSALEDEDVDSDLQKSAKELLQKEILRARERLTPRKMTLLDIFGGGGGKSGRVFAEAGRRISEFKTEEQERQESQRKELLNLLLKQAQMESLEKRMSARAPGAPNIREISMLRAKKSAGTATPEEIALLEEYDRKLPQRGEPTPRNLTDREAAGLRIKLQEGTITPLEKAMLEEYDKRRQSSLGAILEALGNQ